MAYKRKRTTRKRTMRRSMRKRTSSFNSRPIGRQLTLKIFDYTTVTKQLDFSAETPYVGWRDLLNNVQEGTGHYQRIGRTMCMKSLHLKYVLAPLITNTKSTLTRVLVVYDHQNNAQNNQLSVAVPTGPQYSDVIKGFGVVASGAGSFATQVAATGTATVFEGQNPDNYERFKILYDKTHVLPATSTATYTNVGPTSLRPTDIFVNKRISLKNLETKFTTSSLTAASITTGTLLVMVESWQQPGSLNSAPADAVDDSIAITLASRLVYKD